MNTKLSLLFIALASVITLPGQANAISYQPESIKAVEHSNEQLVRKFYTSLGQKDMKIVESYLTDDFSFQNTMNGKRQFGKTTFSNWWLGMVHDATFLETKIERISVIGNLVIFKSAFHYKDKNTDRKFIGTKFVSIKNGKIHEFQEYRLPIKSL